ncbi:MAG TPA: T9SS type A sorting domain-containing protein, partial [Flavitalea sp.]|nr:T9SS type A sorting domain-containing protein [Flavitalea sp.]
EGTAVNRSANGQSSRIMNSSSNETTEAQTAVKAFPNPFNDRVKFVVSVPQPGYGSLEVMNMLGQKIKTIFQGQLNAGNQSFEMVLPQDRYSTLFYIFRINGKQVTGKLIQRN